MAASREVESAALSALGADLLVFVLGMAVALVGDACQVTSGMTRYTWPGVPVIWKSAVWFPLLVGAAVATVARVGKHMGLPRSPRGRVEVLRAVAAVVALYALVAALRGQPAIIAVTLCAALGLVIWSSWDASPSTLALACVCAVVGPLCEIGLVALGAVSYAEDSRALAGVVPSLPCLYFAAGAVASGLHGAWARPEV